MRQIIRYGILMLVLLTITSCIGIGTDEEGQVHIYTPLDPQPAIAQQETQDDSVSQDQGLIVTLQSDTKGIFIPSQGPCSGKKVIEKDNFELLYEENTGLDFCMYDEYNEDTFSFTGLDPDNDYLIGIKAVLLDKNIQDANIVVTDEKGENYVQFTEENTLEAYDYKPVKIDEEYNMIMQSISSSLTPSEYEFNKEQEILQEIWSIDKIPKEQKTEPKQKIYSEKEFTPNTRSYLMDKSQTLHRMRNVPILFKTYPIEDENSITISSDAPVWYMISIIEKIAGKEDPKNQDLSRNAVFDEFPFTMSLSTQTEENPEILFGQIEYSQTATNKIVDYMSCHPGGVLIDTFSDQSQPDKVYVHDSGNNRILGFSSIGICGENDKEILDSSHSLFPAEFIFDGIWGMCNQNEWATDQTNNGYVKFSTDSTKEIFSLILYDRVCPEDIEQLTLHFYDSDDYEIEGSLKQYVISELVNNIDDFGLGIEPVTLKINKIGVASIKIVMTPENIAYGNPGISEIFINYNSDNSAPCTSSANCEEGRICLIDIAAKPSRLFGQDKYSLGSADRDNRHMNPATNNRLASVQYPEVTTLSESPRAIQMGIDSSGNIFVPDVNNNRVLKFNKPFGENFALGEGDSIADDVWGQVNFEGRSKNAGQQTISDMGFDMDSYNYRTIYMVSAYIDNTGDLWITDTGNSRVLKFNKESGTIDKNADTVLGQPDMEKGDNHCRSNDYFPERNEMCRPNMVLRRDNTIYVMDCHYNDGCRVLLFDFNNLQNGMSAFDAWFEWTDTLLWPRGMEFDPRDRGIWINNGGKHELILVNWAGQIIEKISGNFLYQNDGGIGVDSGGRIYTSEIYGRTGDQKDQGVLVFNMDDTTEPVAEFAKGKNPVNEAHLSDAFGMAAFQGSLYVSDTRNNRILVWDYYFTKTNAVPASIVLGQPTGSSSDVNIFNSPGQLAIDPNINKDLTVNEGKPVLWIADVQNHRVVGYNLPLKQPLTVSDDIFNSNMKTEDNKIIESTYDYKSWELLQKQINIQVSTNSYTSFITKEPDYIIDNNNLVWIDDISSGPELNNVMGVAFDYYQNRDRIWLSDSYNNRVFGIRDPYSSQPKVEILIGQVLLQGGLCNMDGDPHTPVQNSLCGVTYLNFDYHGNLFITDTGYEGRIGVDEDPKDGANLRLLRFNADTISPPTNNLIKNGLPADGVYVQPDFESRQDCPTPGPCNPISASFNPNPSIDQMYVSFDSYHNPYRQEVLIYDEYMNDATPDSEFNVPAGQAAVTAFDHMGNWLFQDMTWNTIMFFREKTTSTCGNGQIDFGEQCEGEELRGFTCSDFGLIVPSDRPGLSCFSNCLFNFMGCIIPYSINLPLVIK